MALKYLEVGQIFKNNQGYEYKIESKAAYNKVTVRFLENNTTKVTTANYAYNGTVRIDRFNVGEKYKDKNGETITVLENTGTAKILVAWDDGETRFTTGYSIGNGLVIRTNDNRLLNPSVKVGQVYINKQGSEIKVIDYESSKKVLVEIGERKYRSYVSSGNLKSLNIHDKYAPSVAGKGIYGDAVVDVKSQAYVSWSGMLKRCYLFYDYNPRAKINYGDCEVSDEFIYLENYLEWFRDQKVEKGWQLDKDLLVRGNKVYSPDTCVFLPRSLNTFLTSRGNARGPYPVGVTFHENTGHFEAACNRYGKRKYLGVYKTPEEAFKAYKTEKEDYAKELAEEWRGVIDSRAYVALLNYKVDITD